MGNCIVARFVNHPGDAGHRPVSKFDLLSLETKHEYKTGLEFDDIYICFNKYSICKCFYSGTWIYKCLCVSKKYIST